MEIKKNNIVLAALDFSETSDYVLEHAAGIAKMFQYKVMILHIYHKKSKYTQYETVQKMGEIAKQMAESNGIEVDFLVKEGTVTTAIGEFSKEIGANYLVMGSRGKTGVEYIFGNYALKIIEKVDIPSIVVQKSNFKGYENMIFPVDSTEETKQKVKWAVLFAKKWNSTIHIFAKHSSDQFLQKKVMTNIMLIKKMFDDNNVKYTVTFSSDKKTIWGKQHLQFAVKLNADMVVSMTDMDAFVPTFSALESLIPGIFTGSNVTSTEEEEFIKAASKIAVMTINPKDFNVIIGGL